MEEQTDSQRRESRDELRRDMSEREWMWMLCCAVVHFVRLTMEITDRRKEPLLLLLLLLLQMLRTSATDSLHDHQDLAIIIIIGSVRVSSDHQQQRTARVPFPVR